MKEARNRSGMTLMEIMMSVLVLGLGLLGILSVIPFIEYHTARVVESDYVAAAGKNAFAQIIGNNWVLPSTWQEYCDNNGNPLCDELNNLVPVTGNFVCPRFFDVFGEHGRENANGTGFPSWAIDLGIDVIPHVYPYGAYPVDSKANTAYLDNWRGHDDVVYERDEDPQYRPEFLLDEISGTNRPEFTGTYSWAAMMMPVASDPSISYTNLTFPSNAKTIFNGFPFTWANTESGAVTYAGTPQADVAMKVDVMVFRARDPSDENDFIVGTVERVDGTGYEGGLIEISTSLPKEFQNSLDSSTHILLIGPSDQAAQNSGAASFSAWYKIANSRKAGNLFQVTLTGPTTPACWLNSDYCAENVRAVLFRNLRGIFTRTIPISSEE